MERSGTVVTDGRVLLASEPDDEWHGLTVIPRTVRIDGQAMSSAERSNVVRALAREATNRNARLQVLPPEREQFLQTYQTLARENKDVVSVHLLEQLDGALREARVCRQLLQPTHNVHVYEAKTLEGGLEFLLKTALRVAAAGATATQVLTLLRYLETHMLTFLITAGVGAPQPWMPLNFVQRSRSLMPGTETLWFFDPRERKLQVVQQGVRLHEHLGAALQARWGALRYTALLRYRGYTPQQLDAMRKSLSSAGLPDAPRSEPVGATFVAGLPKQFIELVLLPTDADLRRLQGLVHDLAWWKGAA